MFFGENEKSQKSVETEIVKTKVIKMAGKFEIPRMIEENWEYSKILKILSGLSRSLKGKLILLLKSVEFQKDMMARLYL